MIQDTFGTKCTKQVALALYINKVVISIGIANFKPSLSTWVYFGPLLSPNYKWLRMYRVAWVAIQIGHKNG